MKLVVNGSIREVDAAGDMPLLWSFATCSISPA